MKAEQTKGKWKTWHKVALAGGLAGSLLLLTSMVKAANATMQLEFFPVLDFQSIQLMQLNLRLDLRIKNPTQTQVEIRYPFFTLHYDGNSLGSSVPQEKTVVIPALSQTEVKGIILEIPNWRLVGALSEIMKVFTGKKEQVVIKVCVQSVIVTGVKNLPIDECMEVPLKKPKTGKGENTVAA